MNINRRKHWIMICLTAVCAAACSTDTLPDVSEMSEDLSLQIQPSISDATVKTRMSINTSTFVQGGTIAMSIFPENGYDTNKGIDGSASYPPIPEYNRIDATYSINATSYKPVAFQTAIPSLYLKRNAGPVDVYAYYPSTAERAEKLEEIPFTLGKTYAQNYDYMVPVNGKSTVDPAQYPTDISYELPLEFYHIMTQLEFRLTASFWGQDLFSHFYFNCVRSGQPAKVIGTKGTFSFFSGAVTPTDWDSEWVFSGIYIPALSKLETSIQGFILPPIELQKDDEDIILSVDIRFNEQTSKQEPVPMQTEPYQISLKSLTATDATGNVRYGLLPGYKYVINVKIDNFVKYTGVPSMVKWTDVSMEIPI